MQLWVMLRQLWHPRKFLDMHCPLQVFVEFLWPVWNLNNINDLLKSRHQQYFSIRLQWRIAWRPSAFLSLVSHPFLEDPLLPKRETLTLISSQEMVQLTEFMPSTWISPQAQWPCFEFQIWSHFWYFGRFATTTDIFALVCFGLKKLKVAKSAARHCFFPCSFLSSYKFLFSFAVSFLNISFGRQILH